MRVDGKRWGIRILRAAAAAWIAIGAGYAQEEKTDAKREDGKIASDPARASLEERLRALEKEESAMAEIASRLESGQEVDLRELSRSWVPPAVYRASLPEPLGGGEITDAAFKEAAKMLESKEAEMKSLEAIRVQVQTGEAVAAEDMEGLGSLGLEGREKELAEHLAEVEALREQLEELRFQERFLRAADLTATLEGEGAVPETIETRETAAPPEAEEPHGSETDRTPVRKARIVTSLLALAETCYRAGEYQKAWDALEAVDRAAHAQGDRILYLVGRCREKLGDLEGARASYTELAKAYPESFWAKATSFALAMVDWKEELGPVLGAPPEVYKVIGRVAEPRERDSEQEVHP